MFKNSPLVNSLIISIIFAATPYFLVANTERPTLDIVLAIDHSYSMFESKDSRMYEAQVAAINFIDNLDSQYDKVALMRFSDYAELQRPLGTPFKDVKNKIDSYHIDYFSKYTDISKAVKKAIEELTSDRSRSGAKKYIILLSDGGLNRPLLNGRENASYARTRALQEADTATHFGIAIHTVTIGKSDTDQILLQEISARTRGKNYIAKSPIDLIPIYERIADTITKNRIKEGGVAAVNTSPVVSARPSYIYYQNDTREVEDGYIYPIEDSYSLDSLLDIDYGKEGQNQKNKESGSLNLFLIIIIAIFLQGVIAYFVWLYQSRRLN